MSGPTKDGNNVMVGPKISEHAMSMLLSLVVETESSNGADGMEDGGRLPALPQLLTLIAMKAEVIRVSCTLSMVQE